MADQLPPLVLLAAISKLLVHELERPEHQSFASEQFKADVRAFADRVESELSGRAQA